MVDFVKEYLGDLKLFKVLFNVWDVVYDSLVNLGRIDWLGCIVVMNCMVDFFSCFKEEVLFIIVGCNSDMFWINVVINFVFKKIFFYDVVMLFVKMSVVMYEM